MALKGNRVETISEISFFMNEVAERGGIVCMSTAGSGAALDQSAALVTNYNRTYGDFAAGEALDFMVLNRRYEVGNNNTIEDLTTYIDPQKYIEIFADTSNLRIVTGKQIGRAHV